ncbi:MAG TPA: saccharopine dehydrogenase C-terminal domain-containing protein [Gemmatimonadaceae bacterium]|nr:saccharopine dehydrogenase C-terminal domain-containing protein [Gemmatimonadaceae bacterium]
MKMLVLGAGLQGSACAYDLLQHDDVTEVRLADIRIGELPAFLAPLSGKRLIPTPLDVRDSEAVSALMRESDAVMSALPYYFNYDMAVCAVDAGVHFCDLGGNTDIVFQQKTLHERARAEEASIIPDCGLAPGMVNILAEHGIRQLDSVDAVRIYVGGLPQNPEPPLNYQIVYSLEGVLDYYTTLSWVLRGGKRTRVKALSEREPVEFPSPLGTLEAFHTAGGLSTMAFRYEGRVPTMEYKTLRYPGHAALMEAIRELGLLDLEPIDVKGHHVIPRDAFIATVGPRLKKPQGKDLVALRVAVEGKKEGKARRLAWELLDYHDAKHGISAMERTTGFSLAITGLMQVRQQVTGAGVMTPDEAMPPARYIEELAKRGINIREV